MEAEKKQELIDEVIEQIKDDIMSGDCTVLDDTSQQPYFFITRGKMV